MADAGIKISQLTFVNTPRDEDYMVLVQDGYTRRTCISSIGNLFSQGKIGDINNLKERVTTLEKEKSELSTAIDDNKLDTDGKITLVDGKCATIETDIIKAQLSVNDIQDEIDAVSSQLNDISILINDPDLLSSLTSLISMLSDDDGKTALSNITKYIDEISSNVLLIKNTVNNYIVPELDTASTAVQNIIDDKYNDGTIQDSNSLIATDINDSYDLTFDRYVFANAQRNGGHYSRIELSGVLTSDTEQKRKVILNDLPDGVSNVDSFINDLITHYDEDRTYQSVGTLKYVSIVSAECLSIENDTMIRNVSSFYSTTVENDVPTITPLTPTTKDADFEGETTFALNMVPIRTGMFKIVNNDEDKRIYMEMNLSGNSDFMLYYVDEAQVVDGYKCKISITANHRLLSKRKATTKTTTNDSDLNLIYQKTLKGGTELEFFIADDLTSVNDPSIVKTVSQAITDGITISQSRIIAAINAICLPSEKHDLAIENLSAWTLSSINSDHEEEIDNTKLQYSLYGGRTGDSYDIKIFQYQDRGNEPTEVPMIGSPKLTIDNTLYSNSEIIELYDTKLKDCYVNLTLKKESDPNTVISSDFYIEDYISKN